MALSLESVADVRLTVGLVGSMAYMVVAVSMGGYYLWFLDEAVTPRILAGAGVILVGTALALGLVGAR
ncbi:hypothetical protein L545_4018, partial [Bordetella pertussis STO1-CHLA-0011]